MWEIPVAGGVSSGRDIVPAMSGSGVGGRSSGVVLQNLAAFGGGIGLHVGPTRSENGYVSNEEWRKRSAGSEDAYVRFVLSFVCLFVGSVYSLYANSKCMRSISRVVL
ncbi:LOW QUALITY PROTEIN: hypothetical protein PanWU01x14_170160 [Parasponia andersonii]|uniref:Transmembrane protein n=1 Tax=Parasponia andersonii TaxID=3476 RepID=A0A2P5CA30_PARAD|nr:LOW QUALITY PROTEIN: hypothetical protein PanWU01x14_170160 [Parasponia andersonii]